MAFSLLNENDFFRLVFETATCGMIIVDSGGCVQALNPEGSKIFCVVSKPDSPLKGGDLLRCVNVGDGCGTAIACETCILRTNAIKAINGNEVSKQKGKFAVYREGEIKQFTFLVSATPLVYHQSNMALLVVEDISLITELSGLIPICACCHRIRDDKGEWVSFINYLREHSEADLTHDYCPSCLDSHKVS